MLANRISYWLGVTGPSYTLDSACSSSLIALEHAYRYLQDGQCDAAIVGGSNLCLHPYVSLQFSRLGTIPRPRLLEYKREVKTHVPLERILKKGKIILTAYTLINNQVKFIVKRYFIRIEWNIRMRRKFEKKKIPVSC